MKKSLVALAAFAAVSAYAQSSVTLYGVVDVGYGSQKTTSRDGTGFIKSSGVMDGANAGSRIGFRGTEDLGGGLKANFVVEQGISPTNGSLFGARTATAGHQIDGFSAAGSAAAVSGAAGAYSLGTNRQTYVGLSSANMGTVNIGYQYAIVYQMSTLEGYNIGSEGVPGADKAHTYGNAAIGGTRANGLTYISPNFSGFTVTAQYGAGTGRESVESNTALTNGLTTDKNRRMGLMLKYANGPLSAAISHTRMRTTQDNATAAGVHLVAGAATTLYGVAGAAGTTVQTGATRSANLTQLGGSYNFGVLTLAGTHNRGKNDGTATSTQSTKYRSTQLGLSAPFGALVPFITVGRAKSTNETTGIVTEDYKSSQIGVRYNMSKRTVAYAFYGQTKNDAAAATGATTFYKDKKTVVGVQHAF